MRYATIIVVVLSLFVSTTGRTETPLSRKPGSVVGMLPASTAVQELPATPSPPPVHVVNQPQRVNLALYQMTQFELPGHIETTRVPPIYRVCNPGATDKGPCPKDPDFVIEGDDTNTLYVTPMKAVSKPVTLFIVCDGITYDFVVSVGKGDQYDRRIVSELSPTEVARRKVLADLQQQFQARAAALERDITGFERFIDVMKRENKIKRVNKIVYSNSGLYVRLEAQIKNYYILKTNMAPDVFQVKDGQFVHDYILTTSKSLRVLDKEIEL